MSWKEFLLTSLGNIHKVFRRLSRKRWFRLTGQDQFFVIHDSSDGSSTNDELIELGFEVEDYRSFK